MIHVKSDSRKFWEGGQSPLLSTCSLGHNYSSVLTCCQETQQSNSEGHFNFWVLRFCSSSLLMCVRMLYILIAQLLRNPDTHIRDLDGVPFSKLQLGPTQSSPVHDGQLGSEQSYNNDLHVYVHVCPCIHKCICALVCVLIYLKHEKNQYLKDEVTGRDRD